MLNAKFQQINDTLAQMAAEPNTFSHGVTAARQILSLLEIELEQQELFLQDNKTINHKHWFKKHPVLTSERAAVNLRAKPESNLEAKIYWLTTKKSFRQRIVGAVHFTANYEDSDITRHRKLPVAIDFFLNSTATELTIALSNRGVVRTLTLSGRLTNTTSSILSKWAELRQIKDHARLHEGLWQSAQLSEVNKKFYKEITEYFKELVTAANKHEKLSEEDAKQFANKLLGRLLFVWFLRKKDVIDESQKYFEHITDSEAYYKNVLSRLFFSTLNTPVEERDQMTVKKQRQLFAEEDKNTQKSLFDVDTKTPYLNGGLFDQNELDKIEGIPLPSNFFGRIYSFFDEYNFTTDESTPDFEQVAIDPEMLGRIFENLLAEQVCETGEQARKASGAFYTPREIVDYMCRESLRQYLYNQLNTQVQNAEQIVDQLIDTPENVWAIDENNRSRHLFEKRMDERDATRRAIEEIKIFDPACGSGAYPLGMLQLLVRVMLRIDNTLDEYQVKMKLLRDCIYGADINPMAADISRLRSWLSLIVDETNQELQNHPLPNLDFKFISANSLVYANKQFDLDQSKNANARSQMVGIIRKYFQATEKLEKRKLRSEFEKYHNMLSQSSMFGDTAANDQIISFNPFNSRKVANFFDPKLMFGSESDNPFDIVIGNPPYIHFEKMDKTTRQEYKKLTYKTFEARGDIYTLFYEQGVKLLKKNGILTYITSNKWMRAGYGKSLRDYFVENTAPLSLIDLGGGIFDSATVDTNIIVLRKSAYTRSTQAVAATSDFDTKSMSEYIRQNSIEIKYKHGDSWVILNPIEQSIKEKIEKYGTPLKDWDIQINYGVKTGLNEAYIIDEETRDGLVKADPKSAEIIRPILRGKDIKRDSYEFKDLYVILAYFGSHKVIPIKYPAIYKHLKSFEEKLKQRGQCRYTSSGKPNTNGEYPGQHHWLELDNNPRQTYMDDFNRQKIIFSRISGNEPCFSLDDSGYMTNDTGYVITGKNLDYLLDQLTSDVVWFAFKRFYMGGGIEREFKVNNLANLPIPLPNAHAIEFTDEEMNFISSSVKS